MEEPTVDRVTRQRNIQLQKQLVGRLQIINEEYRMVKQDQEKNIRELSDFVTCLRHTAPGLSSYGQPDTRTMTTRHVTPNRKSVHWETDGSVDKMYLQTARKAPCLNVNNRFADASPRPPINNDATAYAANHHTNLRTSAPNNPRPGSEPAARNSFFNKRIVLDARRHSFITNTMKGATSAAAAGNTGSPKSPVASPRYKHNVKPPRQGEVTPTAQVQNYRRASVPKYGRDAYSTQEQKDRNNLLKKFDYIFESYTTNSRPKAGSIMNLGNILPAQNDETKFAKSKSPERKSLLANRRVVWSAPVKHSVDAISLVTCANSVVSQVQYDKLSHSPGGSCATSLHAGKTFPRPCSTMPRQVCHDDQDSDSRAFSHHGFPYRNRPKTAPPSYELKQRGVAAPRQQVAGILADIQSRRADTRAILSKSRQLHQVVRTLTPQLSQDDDSD